MDVVLCKSLYRDITELLKGKNITEILIETVDTTISSLASMKNALPDYTVLTDNILSDKLSEMRQIKSLE